VGRRVFVISTTNSRGLSSRFSRQEPLFSIQVPPQLFSWGWVYRVPYAIILRKSCSARNRTRDLWICSHEFWPLDYRGGTYEYIPYRNQLYTLRISYLLFHVLKCTRILSNMNLKIYVRFEVFRAVTMKNGVFWDVTPCGSCKNRRFGGTFGISSQRASVASYI
jgi:hypothetical protein